jgi:membrane protein
LLSLGLLSALWSSSAALSAIIGAINRAYDIDEGRSCWTVRLTAVCLTIGLAVFILLSLMLVLIGPELANLLAAQLGLGSAFEWTWKIM